MLVRFRFFTAGESHGQCLLAIVDGVPSGLELSAKYINDELRRRQVGYGRSERMRIECDEVELLSGVRHGTGRVILIGFPNWST